MAVEENKPTIREKTEQVITPIKAELIWFAILILAIVATWKLAIMTEKIGFLEDNDITRQEAGK